VRIRTTDQQTVIHTNPIFDQKLRNSNTTAASAYQKYRPHAKRKSNKSKTRLSITLLVSLRHFSLVSHHPQELPIWSQKELWMKNSLGRHCSIFQRMIYEKELFNWHDSMESASETSAFCFSAYPSSGALRQNHSSGTQISKSSNSIRRQQLLSILENWWRKLLFPISLAKSRKRHRCSTTAGRLLGRFSGSRDNTWHSLFLKFPVSSLGNYEFFGWLDVATSKHGNFSMIQKQILFICFSVASDKQSFPSFFSLGSEVRRNPITQFRKRCGRGVLEVFIYASKVWVYECQDYKLWLSFIQSFTSFSCDFQTSWSGLFYRTWRECVLGISG